ncbi:MAG: hypothetical protein IEMM0008_1695 [bacterium]|nr:MAG: hypothetical protein IEMM0008_1695 [bacterium]
MTLEFIRNCNIFRDFTTEQKAFLYRMLEERRYTKDEIIVEEGAVDKTLYLIYSGSVRVLKKTDMGEEVEIAFITAGNYFGEFSLIDHEPRSASVVAFEDSLVYQLNLLSYTELCRLHPEVEVKMLKGFLLDTVTKLRNSSVDAAVTQGFLLSL